MKRGAFIVVLLFCYSFSSIAQDEPKPDSTKLWKLGGVFNLNFSQVALSNWAAGGQNSIAINGMTSLFAKYKKGKSSWDNTLDVGYGVIKQDDEDFQKSDDRIELTSKFGYGIKTSEAWKYSALASFRTQMAPGYNFPNDSVKISDLLSPGYLQIALGVDYNPNDKLTLLISPLSGKVTFVLDDTLAAAGAFGVESGENVRFEFGASFQGEYKQTIVENVDLTTKLGLFSNYLENPQNIDINWETLIAMKVNKFLTASISTHLIYDHDILIAVDRDEDGEPDGVGPRTQFKEVLAVGLSFKF